MRYMAYILLTAALLCAASCGNDIDNPTPLPQEAEVQETAFAEGADISWVTQMESDGQRFHNAAGEERECTTLMKAGAERGEESHIDNKIRMTYLEIHPYAC